MNRAGNMLNNAEEKENDAYGDVYEQFYNIYSELGEHDQVLVAREFWNEALNIAVEHSSNTENNDVAVHDDDNGVSVLTSIHVPLDMIVKRDKAIEHIREVAASITDCRIVTSHCVTDDGEYIVLCECSSTDHGYSLFVSNTVAFASVMPFFIGEPDDIVCEIRVLNC